MPGIATHLFFAEDLLAAVPALQGLTADERDAFVLGCQGPDPLLFASMRIVNPSLYTIGTRMHNERTNELLVAVCASWKVLPEDQQPLGRAFALGFICHYLLDSRVHPLVYAQQHACCGVEDVDGLSMDSLGEAHAAIETSIDEMLMVHRLGPEVASSENLAESCLPGGEEVLEAVSMMFDGVVPVVYGQSVPHDFFAACVRGYKRVETAVDFARRKGVLPAGVPDGMFHLLPFFRQLGHSATPNESTPFTNDDHLAWEFPFEPSREVSESFDELYAQAFNEAFVLLPQLMERSLTLSGARSLTGGLNFKGAQIQ